MEWWHEFKEWLKPEHIIAVGGLFILLAVIFAETGLFFGFFFPGDSLLFVAGLAVSPSNTLKYQMPVGLAGLIILVYIAAVAGNFVGYYFGRYMGPRLFKRDDSLIFKKKHLEMTQGFYDRYGKAAIILGRFLPIVRTFVPILAGAIRLDYKKFTAYNLIGAALWVPTFILLGYWLGSYEWVKDNLETIVIGLIVITIIPVIRAYFIERKKLGKAKKKTEAINE